MALDEKDIKALQLLIREELRAQISPFREEVAKFQSETQHNFDILFANDERREQENLALNEQLKRHDQRIEALEKKVA